MSGECEYCGEPCETPTAWFAIVSSGFGRANDEQRRFCSVECRTWWRRRCSDHPGAWEQPAPKGYQGRLDEFGDDDDAPSASVTASPATTGRQVATDGGRVENHDTHDEDDPRHPHPEPEIKPLSEARCPECGSEDGIERIDHPRFPPDQSGRCPACGHRADPLGFHHCWKWEHMSEDEREQARQARERYEDKMAEYQHSATYLSAQREP